MKCLCGCGITTTPGRSYRQGHWVRTPQGVKTNSETHLKGVSVDHGDGYRTINAGIQKGHKLEHRIVAENMIGRMLLDTEIVHHKDENRGNNDPSNLVVCKNDAEHQALHLQIRALKECGHADWRKCSFCKKWDAPENLYIPPRKGTIEHRSCGNAYRLNRKNARGLSL